MLIAFIALVALLNAALGKACVLVQQLWAGYPGAHSAGHPGLDCCARWPG